MNATSSFQALDIMASAAIWSDPHKGLRALLYDTAAKLQSADFLDPEVTNRVLVHLRHALGLLSQYVAEKAAYCHPLLCTKAPALVASLEADQMQIEVMIEALRQRAEQIEYSSGTPRDTAAQGLNHAYNEFMVAYLTHLLREENELPPAAQAHGVAVEITAWWKKSLKSMDPARARHYLAWTIPAQNDHELAQALRSVNRRAPVPVAATLAASLRDILGEERYAKVVRLAGLGHQLELPYTATGAALIGVEEERNVMAVLGRQRLWRYEVSSTQSFVARFEAEAEQILGVKHVHATVSGTVALQLAMLALGIGPGDEIIIPAVTWVGCADAAILCGAVPVLAQVDESISIDPADVERKVSPRTKAIMGVSLYGNPCNLTALQEIANRHRLALIEDNCQAAGVSYRGKRLGGYGDVSVFSTNFMKFISAGDGGFIATNRDDLYAFAVMYTGGKVFPSRKRSMKLSAPTIPFTTLRMNELTGAVALAQLQRLDWLLGRLRQARDRIFVQIGQGKSFRRVLGNDPAGAAGWFTPLIFPSVEACQTFAAAVREQGVHHVSTAKESFAGSEIYHCYPMMAQEQFIPQGGAHWATHFRAMVEKKSVDPRFNPWTHPLYDGDMNYPNGFMDESFAIINRIAMIQTNPRLEPDHCKIIADAIGKADDVVANILQQEV